MEIVPARSVRSLRRRTGRWLHGSRIDRLAIEDAFVAFHNYQLSSLQIACDLYLGPDLDLQLDDRAPHTPQSLGVLFDEADLSRPIAFEGSGRLC